MAEYDWDYTIRTINKFQHGPSSKNNSLKEKGPKTSKQTKVINALNKLGISVDSLNTLNIIHISGTKGKGSSCAFIESILRSNSYKTGLFTSPHLITLLERIKINGNQLSKETFMHYFWKVYNLLDIQSFDYGYFQFFTILTFFIFIHENIDVAIIETGIGGEYDCTNIITKPKVVGITSINYDHTDLLGSDLSSIAWHKAGIMKPDIIAFTVNQTKEVLDELIKRSKEIKCPLIIVDSIDKYFNKNIKLGIDGEVQKINSSLALQISKTWMNIINKEKQQINSSPLSSNNHLISDIQFCIPLEKDLNALRNTKLRGRCEIVEKLGIKYFIDGAHTIDSMRNCIQWYSEVNKDKKDNINILIFNIKRRKFLEIYIEMMKNLKFHFFLFTPNIIYKYNPSDENSYNPLVSINHCEYIEEKFKQILKGSVNSELNTHRFECVQSTIDFVQKISDTTKKNINVLVTGSLHLVGDVLKVIEN